MALVLVRHGQAEHNVAAEAGLADPGVFNPPLTAEGRRQVARTAAQLPNCAVLLVSPLRRTRETAAIVAAEMTARGIEVDLVESNLAREHRTETADFVDEEERDGMGIESDAALDARLERLRGLLGALASRPDIRAGQSLCLVGHGDVIWQLTARSVTIGEETAVVGKWLPTGGMTTVDVTDWPSDANEVPLSSQHNDCIE